MGRERIIPLSSAHETIEWGKQIGASLPPNSVLALSGELGAGKTTFVQGIAQGLQVEEPIQSPTFVFLNIYEGKLPLFHFDLYRFQKEEDFFALGFEEFLDKGGIAAIEWPERIASLLPLHTLFIHLDYKSTGRELHLSSKVNECLC